MEVEDPAEKEEARKKAQEAVKSIKRSEVKSRVATIAGAISLLSFFFFMVIFFIYFAAENVRTYILSGSLALISLVFTFLFLFGIEYAEIQELDDLLAESEEPCPLD